MFADPEAMERRRAAEATLRKLNPEMYRDVDKWLDNEVYESLYGAKGSERAPPSHVPALVELLRARREVHAGLRHGLLDPTRTPETRSEGINEFLLQALDAALAHVGDGRNLPPYRDWDGFLPPDWYPRV